MRQRGRPYSEHRRILALRACWTILRGGSVAYRINFVNGGGDALSPDAFFADCQVDGKPMSPCHIFHGDPGPRPEG